MDTRKLEYIKHCIETDKFSPAGCDDNLDIVSCMSKHWRSFSGDGNGHSYFSITNQAARWMLYNLKHTPITLKRCKNVYHISSILSRDGIKNMEPKSPVVIDTTTNTIVDGSTRLYGVAFSGTGTFLRVEFV